MDERVNKAIAAYRKVTTVDQLIKYVRLSADLYKQANEEQRGQLDHEKNLASDRLIGVRMTVAESIYEGLFNAKSFAEVDQILALFELAVDSFASFEIMMVVAGWRAASEKLGRAATC